MIQYIKKEGNVKMEVIFLSSKSYPDYKEANYGDCILIDTGSELIIYDCGSDAHADRVLDYMHLHNYRNAKFILSHNDNDHYAGINRLIDAGAVTEVYTLLLLKYKDELLDLLDDSRISRESLRRRITDAFDNISSLSQRVMLYDVLAKPHISNYIDIVGPNKDYTLKAVAKLLDNSESDNIDNETIANAVSCQVKVKFSTGSLLLCGDSNYEAIHRILSQYSAIQLPHHGKYDHASKIMSDIDEVRTTLYVSDNTGNSNGGSDELMKNCRGYRVLNTINGDQKCCSSDLIIKPHTYLGAL